MVWKSMKRAGVLLGIVFLLVTAGCGSSEADGGMKREDAASSQASAKSAPAADSKSELNMKMKAASEQNSAAVKDSARSANLANAPSTAAGSPPYNASLAAAEAGFGRKLIYRANLVMKVEDYAKTQSDLRSLAALSGGYVVQFGENNSSKELAGNMTLKIPANGFSDFLSEVEKLKPLSIRRSVQGQDVTEEYVDLESRLKAKQVAEARLLVFMEKAAKTEELVAFSNELSKVQEEIERIKGRMRFLEQNVAYSTVDIRLYQEKSGADANAGSLTAEQIYNKMKGTAIASLSVMFAVMQALLIFLAGAIPVLVLLALLSVPIVYWLRRKKKNEV